MTITQRVTFGAAALILTIPLMTACGNNAKDATSSAPARASQPVSPLTTAEKTEAMAEATSQAPTSDQPPILPTRSLWPWKPSLKIMPGRSLWMWTGKTMRML